jgi:hypothetical protein
MQKPIFNYEDSITMFNNNNNKSNKMGPADHYYPNAYQSPLVKGNKYHRKISLEDSSTESSLNPQSLASSKDNFLQTA